jgi:hypothetical protein
LGKVGGKSCQQSRRVVIREKVEIRKSDPFPENIQKLNRKRNIMQKIIHLKKEYIVRAPSFSCS